MSGKPGRHDYTITFNNNNDDNNSPTLSKIIIYNLFQHIVFNTKLSDWTEELSVDNF